MRQASELKASRDRATGLIRTRGQRPRRHAFAGRLLFTLAVTLLILGAAQYQVFSAKLLSSFVRAGETDQKPDARSLELAYESAEGDERPFAEVREVLAYISGRSQVSAVALVDVRGVVVGAGDPAACSVARGNGSLRTQVLGVSSVIG